MVYTPILQIHITPLCNLNCIHCYAKDTLEEELKKQLSFEDWKKIIDDFTDFVHFLKLKKGKIHISGGEPLLYDRLSELILYMKSKKHKVVLLTNGMLISKEKAEFLKKNNVGVSVSLDGLEKTHDTYRGIGTFKKTINGIKILKKEDCYTGISTTLTKLNYKEVEQLIDLAIANNLNIIGFARTVPIGNARNIKRLLLTPKELYRTFERIDTKEKDIEGKKRISRGDPLWCLFYKLKPPEAAKGYFISGCIAGYSFTILSNGIIYPCRRLPVKIGQAPKDSLVNIFLTSKVQAKLRNQNKIKGCKDCPYGPVCRGCRGISYSLNKDFLSKDPYCWYGQKMK